MDGPSLGGPAAAAGKKALVFRPAGRGIGLNAAADAADEWTWTCFSAGRPSPGGSRAARQIGDLWNP